MSTTLSKLAKENLYEQGYQGLPRKEESLWSSSLQFKLNLKTLLENDEAKKLIVKLPPQLIYQTICTDGKEESLELIRLLSTEQITRIFDYDVWHDSLLVPEKVFTWLETFAQISPQQLASRFRLLEEEYQIASLAPFITAYTPDDYEKMSTRQQDELYSLPRNSMYYSINSEKKEVHTTILKLIEATMAEDMNYAISLLSHASQLPPNESEHLLLQFRNARLEEDGFISHEEAMSSFYPLELKKWEIKWEKQTSKLRQTDTDEREKKENLPILKKVPQHFLEETIQELEKSSSHEEILNLKQNFLLLANNLCTLTKIEADNLKALEQILESIYGLCSLSLEFFAKGDKKLACQILKEEHPKVLFRLALSIIRKLREQLLTSMQELNFYQADNLFKHHGLNHFGQSLSLIDQHYSLFLGLQKTEILKGLFNRYPLFPVLDSGDKEKIFFSNIYNLTQVKEIFSLLTAEMSLIATAGGFKKQVPFEGSFIHEIIKILVIGEDQKDLEIKTLVQKFLAIKAINKDKLSEKLSAKANLFLSEEKLALLGTKLEREELLPIIEKEIEFFVARVLSLHKNASNKELETLLSKWS